MLVNRAAIAANEPTIRPYVRHTPILRAHSTDFGFVYHNPLIFKLEFPQHAGSFKTRGAFTNLFTRDIPPVGIAAASGPRVL